MSLPPRSPGRRPASIPTELASGVFTLAEALAAGVSQDQLRGSRYARLHRGVYGARDLPITYDVAARAWMRALPAEAALYGPTAAMWYGLPVRATADFHIIVPAGVVPRRRPGLVPHQGLGPDDAVTYQGLRITTPERTWLDLSLTLGDMALGCVGDAMVQRGLTKPARLVDFADAARGRRRVVRARTLARQIQEGVDSPQETAVRMALVAGGLPCPEVNPDLFDEAGGWIGRPDLAYFEAKVAIQYEGDVHRTSKKRWRSDIARDEVLRDHGWDVILVTADDLRRPWWLCQRVQRAIHRQGQRLATAA
jgi:hypothetical protein